MGKQKGNGKGAKAKKGEENTQETEQVPDLTGGLGNEAMKERLGLGRTDQDPLDAWSLLMEEGDDELYDFGEPVNELGSDEDSIELIDFGEDPIELVEVDDDVSRSEPEGGSWLRQHATKEISEENTTVRTKVGDTQRKLESAREKEDQGKIAKYEAKLAQREKKARKGLHLSEDDRRVLGGVGWPEDPFAFEVDGRLKNGPMLQDGELQAIEALSRSEDGAYWLSCAGLFTMRRALEFLEAGEFYEWLLLEPATRIQLATLAWRFGIGKNPTTPAYSLGRHFALRKSEDPMERVEAENDLDLDVRSQFRSTMTPHENTRETIEAIEGGAILSPTEGKGGVVEKGLTPKFLPKSKEKDPDQIQLQNDQAIGILEKVFLLLQAGLQIYDEELGRHVDLEGVDVCRALAHGGRVNIRIPAIVGDETGHELTDWLGVTEDGHGAGGAVFARGFGTHHMKIGQNTEDGLGEFVEEGAKGAGARNFWEGTKMWGMNLSSGGYGNLDHNGDVVLPDGGHGHMFFGFTPPTLDTDGALQIGMETTMPGGPSMVGYKHDSNSTEATANPESSFGGHKGDKIGDGKPREVVTRKLVGTKGRDYGSWESTNARFVDLRSVGNGHWLDYLKELHGWYSEAKQYDPQRALDTILGPRGNLP